MKGHHYLYEGLTKPDCVNWKPISWSKLPEMKISIKEKKDELV